MACNKCRKSKNAFNSLSIVKRIEIITNSKTLPEEEKRKMLKQLKKERKKNFLKREDLRLPKKKEGD